VDEGSYCWSHGYLVTQNHASANSNFPKDRHQKTAMQIKQHGQQSTGQTNSLTGWSEQSSRR
jgi:hypothetical protein